MNHQGYADPLARSDHSVSIGKAFGKRFLADCSSRILRRELNQRPMRTYCCHDIRKVWFFGAEHLLRTGVDFGYSMSRSGTFGLSAIHVADRSDISAELTPRMQVVLRKEPATD